MNTTLPNIASVSDFQRNYPSLLKKLNTGKSPLLMLKNNQVQAVLLDPSDYQILIDKIQMYELQEAKEKIRNYSKEKSEGALKKADKVDDLFA